MPAVGTNYGEGGAHLTPGANDPKLGDVLRAMIDDMNALRTAITTLTAKIDADSGDTGGDSDYADVCDPDELSTTKGP